MCLVALALEAHERFPLVVAANRDEHHARATEALGWWTPAAAASPLLGGRDLVAGGTWLGLTRAGRLALLTNIRAPHANDPAAPSRGRIVTDWLASGEPVETFWEHIAARRHNGFNLVVADLPSAGWFWASSAGRAPQPIAAGIHAISNAALDTPWPKTEHLKVRLADALCDADSLDGLTQALFAALGDRRRADDAQLPATGLPIEVERGLSSAFVDLPERGYGTRCSTLLISERDARGIRTHVIERSFRPWPERAVTMRRTVLEDWPPRAKRGPAAAGTARAKAAGTTAIEGD
jgi:uncharacterized protein with NRDE domain